MRARLVFIVAAILLVAGFAALNWSEFMRPAPLSFGAGTVDAPLGAVMLVILGVALLFFLFASAVQQSRYLMESNRHAKSLQAQRDLAERAEASRFTDLRQQLDAHLRENRQRESLASTELEKAMVQSQRELRSQLDLINRTLDGRLTELEGRLAARLERLQPPAAEVPPRERVNT
jgi:DNA anti-recombination protein RmuC